MIDVYVLIGVCLVVFVGIITVSIWFLTKQDFVDIELPEKRAGRLGENYASSVIREILRDDDVMFTNVRIMAEGKQAELDNLIINKYGVFIIEVKNYAGELFGDEEDDDWIQTKETPGGSVYQKEVRNPIKQVKRQVYVLSRLLKENGIHVWIDGYVFFAQNNSPIESKHVLRAQHDIDFAIHLNDCKVSEEDARRIKYLIRNS